MSCIDEYISGNDICNQTDEQRAFDLIIALFLEKAKEKALAHATIRMQARPVQPLKMI